MDCRFCRFWLELQGHGLPLEFLKQACEHLVNTQPDVLAQFLGDRKVVDSLWEQDAKGVAFADEGCEAANGCCRGLAGG
jgi:hypothetical protein